MNSAAPAGHAIYNALQTKLDKRLANGLSFQANYSWSRAENYANDPAFTEYKRTSWGRNDTNRTHVFVFSSVYNLPFGKGKTFLGHANRVLDYAVGGYTLAGQTTWESGRPFTPTYQECGADERLEYGDACALAVHTGSAVGGSRRGLGAVQPAGVRDFRRCGPQLADRPSRLLCRCVSA